MSTPTVTKACPDCGQPLVKRQNGQTGHEFLGCSQYPRCRHTEELPETLRMRLLGAPELPIFDDETTA